MNEIIKKLTSYNIFNYLLPGIIFVVIVQCVTSYKFIQGDTVVDLFLYYFIGLVVSRFGSLIIEPFFKRIKFVKFSEYKDFIVASKNDNKLEIFLEQNNMYRTFISMLMLILLLKTYETTQSSLNYLPIGGDKYILLVGIMLIFILSYLKQTKYITNRINLNK